ncbi:protein ACCELERATED CELL DEATH 6-like isoform X2 [Macadamia integrifolia]|uniref:protein ACCELERATED CELL DEATH 6-like isoform X2 n=1 Tax=Macadamia integrifolia TaxID=60698 RepID=UPI001C4F4D7D|nr:protein ACCELERATED CELL DEATH 6-like isoform X2 [Macadamia integrifolia]
MDPVLYKAVTEGNSALLSQVLKAELAEEDDLHQQQQSDDQHNDNNDLLHIADDDSNREVVRDTLLHTAANYNNVQVVKVIRENQPTSILRSKNYREDTALHIAARHNNAEVVKYLLDWAKETDEAENGCKRYEMAKLKNRDGNTALHEAVLRRHREVIEVLMESHKFLIFMKNNRRESPLYLAAERGLHVVLEKMLKVALEEENFNKKKKDLRIFDGPDGRTPLHAAVAKKHTLCINILLDKKKEIRRIDANGRNPLHYAASLGHSEEACCLLQKDTSIAHQKDNEGLCPIHIAVNKGYLGIIQAVLKYCPEVIETLNNDDQNVVHLAAKSGRKNLVSYMIYQKSNMFDKLLNAKDINGNTPLHLATLHSHPNVVNILMWDRNVDMANMNDEGLTARDIAEQQMYGTISMPKFLCRTALRIYDAPSGRPSPIIVENNSRTDTQNIHKYKGRFNTLVLVATLICTVTFAAGFTVPGGFNVDGPYNGMATLLRKPAFNVFVICNTMALYLSIVIVVNNICAQLADIHVFILVAKFSSPLLGLALIMMAVAFAAGGIFRGDKGNSNGYFTRNIRMRSIGQSLTVTEKSMSLLISLQSMELELRHQPHG